MHFPFLVPALPGDDGMDGLHAGVNAAPSMGRITGSASIETLVRVGIEKENGLSPEAKMVVLHDFTPCVDDELEVKRGQVRSRRARRRGERKLLHAGPLRVKERGKDTPHVELDVKGQAGVARGGKGSEEESARAEKSRFIRSFPDQ